MGKIPALQELRVEDFPKEQQEWLPPLFNAINRFFRTTITAVNGGIDFETNIRGDEHEFDFEYISVATTFPQKFLWKLGKRPKACQLVQCTEDGVPIMAVMSWEYTPENYVQLTDLLKLESGTPGVAALTANSRYKVLVRITP